MGDPSELDALIHAPVRLAIMSALIPVERVAFTVLRDQVGATDGNLASHLGKLEKAGYVTIEKRFVDRRPQTRVSMTDAGRDAFLAYLDALRKLLPDEPRR